MNDSDDTGLLTFIARCLCGWNKRGEIYSGQGEGTIISSTEGLGLHINNHRGGCKETIQVFGEKDEDKPKFTIG